LKGTRALKDVTMDKNIIKETMLSLEGTALQSAREKSDFARLDRSEPIAPVMLVEHASTTENAGTLGLSLASSQISRAILLQPRLGITLPQTTRSGSAAMACTTGTDRLIAS
jgi:hypothetical protein